MGVVLMRGADLIVVTGVSKTGCWIDDLETIEGLIASVSDR